MRVVIAGAHGKIGLRLGRRLAGRGDEVAGIVRNPAHAADLEAAGMRPVVLDLESAALDDVVTAVAGADAVVFSAGAGPGSGVARKDTVDRAAVVLLADAAERARVRRYVLVSAMGVEGVRGDDTGPDDEVFHAYLVAKLSAVRVGGSLSQAERPRPRMSGASTRRPRAAIHGASPSKSAELRVSPCRHRTGVRAGPSAAA